jgi:hypothetical protein
MEHLRRLPGQEGLPLEDLQGNFLRLRLPGYTLKWERHTEFTRYSLVQPLPEGATLGTSDPELLSHLVLPSDWLAGDSRSHLRRHQTGHAAWRPARTRKAAGDGPHLVWRAARWWVVLGSGHSMAVTDFAAAPQRLRAHAGGGATPTPRNAGRAHLAAAARNRDLPPDGPAWPAGGQGLVAGCWPRPSGSWRPSPPTLESKSTSDQALLDTLVSLAARVERATAEHVYRFSATRAYDSLVAQRIAELRESRFRARRPSANSCSAGCHRPWPRWPPPRSGSPRCPSGSRAPARCCAPGSTSPPKAQNQQLLEKLTRGQELQLRLQSTVEGLSIAAISYYVVSLLLYAGQGARRPGCRCTRSGGWRSDSAGAVGRVAHHSGTPGR